MANLGDHLSKMGSLKEAKEIRKKWVITIARLLEQKNIDP